MKVVIVPVSHVSEKSMERVERVAAEFRPECIAVELDPDRLRALLSRKKPSIIDLMRSPLATLMYLLQKFIGKRFGIEPGSEMLAAVKVASSMGISIALIDRNINTTLLRLSRIPLREKLRLLAEMLLSPFLIISGKGFDVERMVDPHLLKPFKEEFKRKLPKTYEILVEERDEFMAQRIIALPYEKILVVVGAGHVDGIIEKLGGMEGEGRIMIYK